MKEDLGSTQTKLSKFLVKYRNTPHSTAGDTPTTFFMGRNLRSRLDLIKPDTRKHVIEEQVSQAKPKGAIAGNVRQLFIGQAVNVRNYRGKEKWIQGFVRARTVPVSYQVEIVANVIWRRHIDQLLASENITNTQYLEQVTDIPALANENNAKDETPVDIQEQQETLEPNQEIDQVEQPKQRYPVRIRYEPNRLGLDN
ncbi:Hypothetical predicted protein [Paramuricea clavata]|uniref:Uncharacterized protein n=1 Tax=Paramuricea clavata TaxID=317549 RepID=A0A6S7J6B8_PARCT|nr:Hypothetical predicted protein [Paramuricea clavata]